MMHAPKNKALVVAFGASLALVSTAGCHPSASGVTSPETRSVAQTKRNDSNTLSKLASATLEQRIAELEAKLDVVTDDDERRTLTRQRLVLSIAVVEVAKRGADAGEIDLDQLLTGVEMSLAKKATRKPAAPSDGPGKGSGESPKETEGSVVGSHGLGGVGAEDDRRATASKKRPKSKGRTLAARGKEAREFGGEDATTALDDVEQGESGRIEKARTEPAARPPGLMTAIQRRVGAMESCLGSIDDDVTLQVTVRLDAAGAVRLAKVNGVQGDVGSCISRVLQSVRVQDYEGAQRMVRFPLYFQPE